MRYSNLIQLYFERASALQWYWTLYVVIIGGLLAFSSLRTRPDFVTGILITLLFSCFAYKNLGAIQEVTAQQTAALEAIRQYHHSPTDTADTTQGGDLLEPTMHTTDPASTRIFHLSTDLLTIAAIWAMERRRIKMARTAGNAAK